MGEKSRADKQTERRTSIDEVVGGQRRVREENHGLATAEDDNATAVIADDAEAAELSAKDIDRSLGRDKELSSASMNCSADQTKRRCCRRRRHRWAG